MGAAPLDLRGGGRPGSCVHQPPWGPHRYTSEEGGNLVHVCTLPLWGPHRYTSEEGGDLVHACTLPLWGPHRYISEEGGDLVNDVACLAGPAGGQCGQCGLKHACVALGE